MRSMLAVALLAGTVSCGAVQPAIDPVVTAIAEPSPRSASALIEFRDPAEAGIATAPASAPAANFDAIRGTDPEFEVLALVLRSQSVREPASAETGSPIEAEDVAVQRSGPQVWLQVRGDSVESSVARCLAVLRGAERRLHAPDSAAGIALLREQSQRVRQELAALQESIQHTPPRNPVTSDESVDAVRERASALLRAPGDGADPHAILPDDAPGTLRAASAAYLETELAIAQLATRYGPSAIPLVEARERLRVLATQFQTQRRVEMETAQAMIAELDRIAANRLPGAGAHAVERARTAVLLARLAQPLGEDPVVPDDAPLDLRILASESARARLLERVLALRYGPNAPQMITAQVRRETLLERFEERRRENLTMLRARLDALQIPAGRGHVASRGARPSVPAMASQNANASNPSAAGTAVADGRVAREQQLRDTLFILVDRIERAQIDSAAQAPPFRVLNACAVRDEATAQRSVSPAPP